VSRRTVRSYNCSALAAIRFLQTNWHDPKRRERRRTARLAPFHAGAEANQAVNRDACDEVDGNAPVHLEALVTEWVRQVGKEGKVVDCIAEKDGDQVFNPLPRTHSQESLGHGRHRQKKREQEFCTFSYGNRTKASRLGSFRSGVGGGDLLRRDLIFEVVCVEAVEPAGVCLRLRIHQESDGLAARSGQSDIVREVICDPIHFPRSE
jgi:hypothetical protein